MAQRNGSATTTIVQEQAAVVRLRLEPAPAESVRRVQWTEEVIDNENMGKRKSKRCCIFHKRRNFDDSSSDSDTDSDSDDSGNDGPAGGHPHDANDDIGGDHGPDAPSGGRSAGAARRHAKARRKGRDRQTTPVLDPTHCDHCRYLLALEQRSAGGGGGQDGGADGHPPPPPGHTQDAGPHDGGTSVSGGHGHQHHDHGHGHDGCCGEAPA